MAARRVKLEGWHCTCERCGHVWISIGETLPLRCRRCKTALWNKPPQRK
jgi:tRNA(Ile2) C34 agmatinyltransferase TiaS